MGSHVDADEEIVANNNSMGKEIDLNIPLSMPENNCGTLPGQRGENRFHGARDLISVDGQITEEGTYVQLSHGQKDLMKGKKKLIRCTGVNAKVKHIVPSEGKSLSKGGQVKEAEEVLKVRRSKTKRRPNVNCRVGAFGRICGSFDERRKRWVCEMGFGGLLHLVDKHLPRMMCYWLMTRIDPTSEMLCVGKQQFRLSPNQVRWVLGLPVGDRSVPLCCTSENHCVKVNQFRKKYCGVWTSIDSRSGNVVNRTGFSVTPSIVAKLEAQWQEEDAEEFKTLFLMCALVMVLCPTQSWRLSPDLIPALACASESRRYNWCALVLDKLMESVCRFARNFNKYGFASGCGGCTLFIAVFYLDKLARNPVMWGLRPRVKVWTIEEMRKACREDKLPGNGDYGAIGVVDVAYGEAHPREARDINFLSDVE